MVAWGIKDEPEMAIECVLSEIQPLTLRNPNGTWSDGAITIFKNTFTAKSTIAQIYSVVGNVMSVNLLLPECLNACEKSVLENSFNKILIAEGYAEQVDEPYLSRDNHMSREMAFNSPDSLHLSFAPEPIEEDIDIESPSEKECRSKVDLKGPKSPLEMSFYSVSRKSQGMDINVEWSSVNSVLLDTHPMDPHNRMLVGGFIRQNKAGDRLTLRNTTLIPGVHGLPALITMVFAPRVQLRTDSNRTHLTGAICGLGCDPQTKKPYHSENDIELTFDTKFELSDLEVVSKTRY
ncbi:hypothetical protein AAG570_008152 [Ranatra chinensis]|uniref:Uncharacterized protein n=1 Tax=Ranatra chinensis TaxID=642074 RepID=A0ABD0YFQ6_9HEMI